jgi:hypothetical protein
LSWNAATQLPFGNAAIAGLVPTSIPSVVVSVPPPRWLAARSSSSSSNAASYAPSANSATDGLVPAIIPNALSKLEPDEL